MSTSAAASLHHQFRLIEFLGEDTAGSPINISKGNRRKTFRKNPSATTNTTASTTNTISTTSIDVQNNQDDTNNKKAVLRVVTPPSQCQPPRQVPKDKSYSVPSPAIIRPPKAFVDESQADEIEVALKPPPPPPIRVVHSTISGPSITSTLSIDTAPDDDGDHMQYNTVTPDHGNSFTYPTVGGGLLLEVKDRYASNAFLCRHMSSSLSITREEDDDITTLVKLSSSSGIPKIATCLHRDDGEDIDSCITASTEGGGGNASYSSYNSYSAHGDRDDPERGPHMLSFLHEQDYSGSDDSTAQYWNQQPYTVHSNSLPATANRTVALTDPKQNERSSRKKGIGHFMSKLINKRK